MALNSSITWTVQDDHGFGDTDLATLRAAEPGDAASDKVAAVLVIHNGDSAYPRATLRLTKRELQELVIVAGAMVAGSEG